MKKHIVRKGASFDAILLTLIKFVTLLLGIIITRLLSQYLSVHAYGTYSQVMMLVSTISYLTILGMIDGVNYFNCSEKDRDKREAYISTLFSLQCIVSAIAGSMIFVLSGKICSYFDNPDLKNVLHFATILPFFQNILLMLQVLIVSIGKAKLLAIRNLVVSLARLAVVIFVISIASDISVILSTVVVLDVCQVAFFVPLLKKYQCLVSIFRADFSLIKRILNYCGPMAIFISINSINRDLDKYLIALLTDTETVALYANASKQLPFDIIMTSFCTVLQPEITRLVAEKRRDRAVPLYKLLLEVALISNVILCGAALSAAPMLIKLLYSEKYMAGLNVFCIYILVDLIRFSNMTLILSAAGETKKVMLLGLGTVVMNGTFNLLLFKLLGIAGPAWATLLTTLMSGIAMVVLSAKALQCKIGEVLDRRYLTQILLQSVLVMVVCVGIRNWLEGLHLHYFIVLIAIAGIFCATMLLLNGKRLLRVVRDINSVTRSKEE